MNDGDERNSATFISDGLEKSAIEDSGFIVSSESHELPSADQTLLAGQCVGKFVVEGMLGRGGMGTVYRAHDPDIDRLVALKVLSHAVAANDSSRRRFRAEGKSAGQLSHPNVVAVYDVGDHDGAPYLVMEFVTGGSVEDLTAGGQAIDLLRATEILADACAGLAAAHHAGLIHRDVKPANLMIDAEGVVKVADFGLARATQSSDPRLTQASRIVGTPYFMSPEQCSGQELDARSDLYSLGATYYTLLAGRSPFESAGSMMDVLAAHLHEKPPLIHKTVDGVPPACSRLIERAMAKSRDERYTTAEEMLIDVEALIDLLKDPRTADRTTYRGITSCARDTFALPSETAKEEQKRQVSEARTATAKRKGGSSIIGSIAGHRKASRNGRSSLSASNPLDTKASSDRQTAMPASAKSSVNSDTADRIVPSGTTMGGTPHSSLPVPAAVRRDVFSLTNGEFLIQAPKTIANDDLPELLAWLDLMKTKVTKWAAAEVLQSGDGSTAASPKKSMPPRKVPRNDEPAQTMVIPLSEDTPRPD